MDVQVFPWILLSPEKHRHRDFGVHSTAAGHSALTAELLFRHLHGSRCHLGSERQLQDTMVEIAEITVQPTVEEASDNCTQECLILGHSDSCWMPASLTHPIPQQIQTSALCHNPPRTNTSVHRCSPPVTQTVGICQIPPVTQPIALCHSPPSVQAASLHHSPPLAQATALCHSPPPVKASAVCYSLPLSHSLVIHHSTPLSQAATLHSTQVQQPMSLQQGWVQGAGADGLHPLDQGVQGSTRSQFYTMAERLHPDDDSIKVIPLTTFTSGQLSRSSKDDSPIMEEHHL
nr:protocadherin-11 X-linked-like [Meriones unguiculatus]